MEHVNHFINLYPLATVSMTVIKDKTPCYTVTSRHTCSSEGTPVDELVMLPAERQLSASRELRPGMRWNLNEAHVWSWIEQSKQRIDTNFPRWCPQVETDRTGDRSGRIEPAQTWKHQHPLTWRLHKNHWLHVVANLLPVFQWPLSSRTYFSIDVSSSLTVVEDLPWSDVLTSKIDAFVKNNDVECFTSFLNVCSASYVPLLIEAQRIPIQMFRILFSPWGALLFL